MDFLLAYGQNLLDAVTGLNARYAAFYLLCTVAIAFGIWLWRGRPDSFLRWILPREVYRHRSNLLDIKLILTNRMLGVAGFFGAVIFAPLVTFTLLEMFHGDPVEYASLAAPTLWRSAIATVLIVLTADFCVYWSHRISHEWKILWPFHAVHHSAAVLTPLTVSRTHPVEIVIRHLVNSVLVGLVQALILYLLMGQVDLLTIGGANAAHFVFNALGSNFRHSHIWISYGPVLEHILISPAQHQIHHSSARRHHDKNYGSIFALWDWIFGTLYIPDQQEDLKFGVTDANGKYQPDMHPSLRTALLLPFVESWAAVRDKFAGPAAPDTALRPQTMSPGFSLWLDVLRVFAALAVLLGHFAHVRFSRGDYIFLRDWNIASDAVIVFFVLSGTVIAYAAERDGSLNRFAFNRLTRIYSVIIPALLLTALFDAIGTRVDMEAYPAGYYQALAPFEFLWRGLSLSIQWDGVLDPVRLGTNGPLWSLSFEAAFYMMMGVGLFLTGALRIALLALITVVAGLPVLLLLPTWLLGVLVWRAGAPSADMPSARGWMLAVLPIAALIALKVSGLPLVLNQVTADWFAPANHHLLLRYADEFLWNGVMAVCIATHLVGVRRIAAGRTHDQQSKSARAIRWCAGASFSLYVVHYPALHLLDAVVPETMPGHDLALLGGTLAISLVFAALFERPLKRFRNLVRPGWLRLGAVLRPKRHVPAE